MQALIVIDAQNEFSPEGKRPVPAHPTILAAIANRVRQAREAGMPIAWIRHYNKPNESSAFVPGTWGAGFSPAMGPQPASPLETLFEKNVYGAFTGTPILQWLQQHDATAILLTGFYTHGCLSTTAREGIMLGLDVIIDPRATGSCDLDHELLGHLPADEVRRTALLQLANMGCQILATPV
jgi:nicotinamidase-related amidase